MEFSITRPDGRSLTVDMMDQAQFGRSVILPRHPVDPGSAGSVGTVINDSAKLEPKDISISCLLSSEAPAGHPANARREADAIAFFESIVGEYVTLQLPKFRAIEDVQIASFPHSIDIERRTPFNLTFSQVGFGGRSTTEIARVVERAKPDLPPEEDIGEQPTKTASPELSNRTADEVGPSLAKRGVAELASKTKEFF